MRTTTTTVGDDGGPYGESGSDADDGGDMVAGLWRWRQVRRRRLLQLKAIAATTTMTIESVCGSDNKECDDGVGGRSDGGGGGTMQVTPTTVTAGAGVTGAAVAMQHGVMVAVAGM